MGVGGLAMVTVSVRGRCSFARVSRGLPSRLVDKTAQRFLGQPVDRLEPVVGPFPTGSPALSRLVTPPRVVRFSDGS